MSTSSGKSYLIKALENISNMADDELKEWIDVVINKNDKWVKDTDVKKRANADNLATMKCEFKGDGTVDTMIKEGFTHDTSKRVFKLPRRTRY